MKGTLTHELDAPLPAAKVWAVYGTLRMVELIVELLPDFASPIEILKGDGGTGTVVRATVNNAPGATGPVYQTEKFLKVDDERRVKLCKVIEGGMLDLGFLSYLYIFEIIERTNDSCTIKSSIEYEVDEEHEDVAKSASIDDAAVIAKTIVKYLLENESDGCMKVMSSKLCFDYKLWFKRLFHSKARDVKISDAAM